MEFGHCNCIAVAKINLTSTGHKRSGHHPGSILLVVYCCFRSAANWNTTESASSLTTASIWVSLSTDPFRKCQYRNSVRSKSYRCLSRRVFIYFFKSSPTERGYASPFLGQDRKTHFILYQLYVLYIIVFQDHSIIGSVKLVSVRRPTNPKLSFHSNATGR